MKKSILLFALLAIASCVRAQPLPPGEWALINTSCVFMRETPSYTSENVSQSRMGTPVQVLDTTGYWVKIRTPEPYEGWVNDITLAPMPEGWRSAPRYICITERSFICTEPRKGAAHLSDFSMGDIIMKGGDALDGWVSVLMADGRKGWVPEAEVADFREWMSRPHKDFVADVLATARLFLGCPYFWGGISAGLFDCSGLTGFSFFMNGIQLPRDASQQVKCGVEVPPEQMQAGDLLFFGERRVTHVALCTAPNHIIHSSKIVRENSLVEGDPDYYEKNLLYVRRIAGNFKGCTRVLDSPLYFDR